MKRKLLLTSITIAAMMLFVAGRWVDEGMWLLDSIGKLPLDNMKKHGLELTAEQIYSANGTSLKDAIVLLGGGTASFVSASGLLLTNHHVAFSGIQALSSVQDDYLKNGFWAKTKTEELQTNYTAQILVGMKDVTAEVLAAVNDSVSADARAGAIRSASSKIEHDARGTTELSCRVVEMYSGLKYYLFTYQSFPDVRLVYAPPSSIGNFGGEVDNWMWPRHTGDFSFMRVYAAPDGTPAKYSKDNAPYRPKVFLPISTQGYTEGSFAMILGYPGRTFRYREAASIQLAYDETLPVTIDLYKTRMDIINAAGNKDRAVEIKYASRVRSIANTYKNYLGTLEGMKRADLITKRRHDEAEFDAYLQSTPELRAKYGTLLADLEHADADLKTFNRKNLVLSNVMMGIDMLRLGTRLKMEVDRGGDTTAGFPNPFMRGRENIRDFIGALFKDSDQDVDKATFVALIIKNAAMPPDQQMRVFHDITGTATGEKLEKRVREYVDGLYDDSRICTPAGCEKLLAKGIEAIADDPFVKLAAKISDEQGPLMAKSNEFTVRITPLRAKYIAAWLGWKKGELVYPDANRSLRFTYGTVEPYIPRDGVSYRCYTTLTGVMEKEQPDDPFIVPARLKELWRARDYGRYADRKDGEMHVAFLADLDITGGNSGSPVINGRGELIGCAFDGNWEAVVGDFYFQEELNRTISVDARYILFVLDKFSGAENVLKELLLR